MLTPEENSKILQEELGKLREEIVLLYNASGKRTTGEFEKGLEVTVDGNSGTLKGYGYLGGRRAGKMPPIEAIERWIEAKGIKPIEDNMTTSTLAYLIARKIAKEGTRKENNLPIYTAVITPQRIEEILKRIDHLNANSFIAEIVGMITKGFNDFQ